MTWCDVTEQHFMYIDLASIGKQVLLQQISEPEYVQTTKPFAKLSPKPQQQLGAEVVIFPINPTNQPPTHPDKFEISINQDLFENKSCSTTWVAHKKVFEPYPDPQKSQEDPAIKSKSKVRI